ncbi:MAG: CHAP domain-containing protein, partial [Mycobacteriales bacterium]
AVRHLVVHTTAAAPIAAPAPRPTAKPTAKPTARPTTTQSSGVDDYPYRTDATNGFDPWGFTKRQCVSFAAWRLAQHGHALSNSRDNWGSAYTWDDTARRLGRTVTTHPVVGAIAQWNADESSPYYAPGSATANGHFTAGGYGHVAWVKSVYADGSVLVEQYNLGGSRAYSVMRVKAPRYLIL